MTVNAGFKRKRRLLVCRLNFLFAVLAGLAVVAPSHTQTAAAAGKVLDFGLAKLVAAQIKPTRMPPIHPCTNSPRWGGVSR
jgi:hypothetical protein